MHDEAAFLARIRETPADVAPRLVFADWLDEHDDPRGELIRLTEEMRTLAPYSDAYWTKKPRRRELLRGVPDEWLATLGYLNAQPTLSHGVPDDWKGRWRLLRERLERWTGQRMGDVGGQTVAVADVEERLGRTLPPSLREWVALANDLRGQTGYERVLQPDRLLEPVLAHDAVLLDGGSGPVPDSVLLLADWDDDDPPVYHVDRLTSFRQGPQTHEWRRSSLRWWATLWSMFWSRGSFCTMRATQLPNDPTLLEALHETFPVTATIGHSAYFEGPNIIIRYDDNPMRGTGHLTAYATYPATVEHVPMALRKYIDPKRASEIFKAAAKSLRK